MKLKINDVAKLYDVSSHTIRHYEKIGLIFPERSKNGYRVYSYEQLNQLNVIRDLRKFDIPLEKIKDYLYKKDFNKTNNLLNRKLKSINKEIERLIHHEQLINIRLEQLKYVENLREGIISINYHDKRNIICDTSNTNVNDVDLALKELQKQFENHLPYLNQNPFGSFLYLSDDKEKVFKHRVFYVQNEFDSKTSQTIELPAGNYLSVVYFGDYDKSSIYLNKIKKYICQNNITTEDNFFELYLIDFHETNLSSEYVTEIQIKIETNLTPQDSWKKW